MKEEVYSGAAQRRRGQLINDSTETSGEREFRASGGRGATAKQAEQSQLLLQQVPVVRRRPQAHAGRARPLDWSAGSWYSETIFWAAWKPVRPLLQTPCRRLASRAEPVRKARARARTAWVPATEARRQLPLMPALRPPQLLPLRLWGSRLVVSGVL
jgi:hypothetical protein